MKMGRIVKNLLKYIEVFFLIRKPFITPDLTIVLTRWKHLYDQKQETKHTQISSRNAYYEKNRQFTDHKYRF